MPAPGGPRRFARRWARPIRSCARPGPWRSGRVGDAARRAAPPSAAHRSRHYGARRRGLCARADRRHLGVRPDHRPAHRRSGARPRLGPRSDERAGQDRRTQVRRVLRLRAAGPRVARGGGSRRAGAGDRDRGVAARAAARPSPSCCRSPGTRTPMCAGARSTRLAACARKRRPGASPRRCRTSCTSPGPTQPARSLGHSPIPPASRPMPPRPSLVPLVDDRDPGVRINAMARSRPSRRGGSRTAVIARLDDPGPQRARAGRDHARARWAARRRRRRW